LQKEVKRMMKNTRKGFTITELVIVIAVIAILAAVLIPTFSSLIKKANISADTQMAKNLNTALTMAEASGEEIDEFGDALDAMREAGYLLGNLNPTTDGCYLVWESESNQILLVELTEETPNYEVLYKAKEYEGEPDDSWYFAVTTQEEADKIIGILPNVITKLTIVTTSELNKQINNITDGETLYIDGGIAVDEKNVVKVTSSNADVVLDLGSSVITGGSSNTAATAIPFEVTDGKLTLKGGVVSAVSAFVDADGDTGYAAANATGGVLNITDTAFKIDNTQDYLVTYAGGDGTMKNVTIDAPHANTVVGSYDGSEVRLEDCNINCDYAAFFASQSGGVSTIEIDGGTYRCTQTNLICVHGGKVVVEGGTFSAGIPAKTLKFYNVTGGKIVLKGGTFNGVAFANLDEAAIRAMCNLSECSKGITVEQVNGAWEITVK